MSDWKDYVIENLPKRKEPHIPSDFLVKKCGSDCVLVDAETGEIIISGKENAPDYTLSKIEGFFKALEYFDYPYSLEKEV